MRIAAAPWWGLAAWGMGCPNVTWFTFMAE